MNAPKAENRNQGVTLMMYELIGIFCTAAFATGFWMRNWHKRKKQAQHRAERVARLLIQAIQTDDQSAPQSLDGAGSTICP
jgi:hypothetical protein